MHHFAAILLNGLRDYGTATWEGGDPACDHKGMVLASSSSSSSSSSSLAGYTSETVKVRTHTMPQGQICSKCGARRIDAQLGLEASPDEYIAAMVAVFREVRRVLRNDGTLWLNIGDSYAGSWGAQGHRISESDKPTWHSLQINNHPKRASHTGTIRQAGLKPKDLVGIPWMLAFALRADGWWLRQDIIWSKPNPMPESVTDRCTKAHEYLFLLSKSERYHYDAKAIEEASITEDPRRLYTSEGAWMLDGRPAEQRHGGEARSAYRQPNSPQSIKSPHGQGFTRRARTAGNKAHKYVEAYEASDTEEHRTKAGLMAVADVPWYSRNKRSVWTIATAPYPDAHFATFPPALVEPCILAGCPVGGTVLDPFLGAGTTALVADRLGRNSIGIELNPAYAEMARRRIEDDAGMFAQLDAADD